MGDFVSKKIVRINLENPEYCNEIGKFWNKRRTMKIFNKNRINDVNRKLR